MRGSPEQMHATADRMSARADEFWEDVEDLRREAENLIAADWTGDAADTHAVLWDEWVDSARRVTMALSEDAGLLHQAAVRYEDMDEENASAIGSTATMLDL